MKTKLGIILDPIEKIKVKKDTSFALMLAAQKRSWELFYILPHDVFVTNEKVFALATKIQVQDNPADYFHFLDETPKKMALSDFDVVLMRQDPPFDIPYLYLTYILDLAVKNGTLVLNHPRSIRDANEKLFTATFPQCCPPSMVTSRLPLLQAFAKEHKHIIIKPLHAMGGFDVFLLHENSADFSEKINYITKMGKFPIIAQLYLPEIKKGDKRVLMIDGVACPYALARIPATGSIKANLAAGGLGIKHELTTHDQWIASQVGATLKEMGLFLVGLDIIGNYLTEINVTSPTCVREIEALFDVNICADILDKLTLKINLHKMNLK